MKSVITFANATGRILQAMRIDDADAARNVSLSIGVLDSPPVDSSLFYVSGGAVIPRPPHGIAGAIVGRVITLTGIPPGATVIVSGEVRELIDQTDPTGELVLELPIAGAYSVECEVFPTQAYHGEFVAS